MSVYRITGAILAAPLSKGDLGCEWNDHPLCSTGFSFEALPHGLRVSFAGRSVTRPWHRVLQLEEEPAATRDVEPTAAPPRGPPAKAPSRPRRASE